VDKFVCRGVVCSIFGVIVVLISAFLGLTMETHSLVWAVVFIIGSLMFLGGVAYATTAQKRA